MTVHANHLVKLSVDVYTINFQVVVSQTGFTYMILHVYYPQVIDGFSYETWTILYGNWV